MEDQICGLVIRVPGYRSWGVGSISGATRFFWEVVSLELGPLSLVSTSEELTVKAEPCINLTRT
jgi:hypothetical protein